MDHRDLDRRVPLEANGSSALGTRLPGAASGGDPDVELLRPVDDVEDPEVSIVDPRGQRGAHHLRLRRRGASQGLAAAGARGEILIVDSSTDRTAELALAGGARVLRTPKRGLGRAYIDAMPFIRGRYIVMGDADCTYDFRLARAVRREAPAKATSSPWARGGWARSRPGAMPALHRYFGTPVTTWILNRLYGSRFTDIHCGMRGISRDALDRMGLVSQSWEYASEMVLKSVRMKLRTSEVPVTFYKDREGRLSHHKRSGWFSPFQAAWINLRAMFIYRAEFFALKPGPVLLGRSACCSRCRSASGRSRSARSHFSLYWMLLGVTLAVLGLQSFCFGVLAQVLTDYSGQSRLRWTRIFRYTATVVTSIVLFVVGLGLADALVVHYVTNNFALPPPSALLDHLAVTGSLLMIIGFTGFCFTLVLYATGVRYGVPRAPEDRRHELG